MSETKQNREELLFEAASEKLDPEERRAFLDESCRDDPPLRARLEVLLEGHFHGDGFLTKNPERATKVIEPPPEPPSPVIDRYKLLEKIGEGGFGEVWMAEQQAPVKRRVAIKILKLGMDTRQVVGRFEAERQALALMDHPNIARVLDAGATDSGRPYFVMDLVRGIRITDYCDQNNLPTQDRLDLFIQVCQAIQHAHHKGIIHRDIKPSNILVTLHDGVPVPKVIDFGIAKATQQQLTDKTLFTQFQQFIGTPAYVSPEQAGMSGLDIDTRSDIYSLGVLLYELLVGRTPFETNELMQGGLEALRQMIREREPMRPSTKLNTLAGEERTTTARRRQTDAPKLVHLLRGDLDWIVMKCLEKDRTRRYETANGLVMDIKHHLALEPIEARPPDRLYRFQKLVRRNKLTFAAATAVAMALILGIAASSWQLLAARHARNVAETQRERADAQARKASESEQQSRRLLYASDMNLAQQALKLNNLGRARRLLDRHRPQPGEEDLRGWEWRYLWQLTRSSALVTLTNRPTRGYTVSFSPDGTRLAVGWFDGRVDLWDVPDRRWVRGLVDLEQPRQGRVAFSPVRNLLAATSNPKVVTLYDLDSGRESTLWRSPDPGAWEVHDLAFSQDGTRVVIYAGTTPDLGDKVWVVNASSSQIESSHSTLWSGNGSSFYGAAQLSPDNRCLYLARSDVFKNRYSIQCLDLATGKELWLTEGQRDRGLTALAISPDGRVLASGSGFGDTTIFVWDAATGRRLVRLDGHTSWVCRLAFTKDGRRLISAGDQTIRFWDTSTWTETRVLRGHTDEVHAVAISESGQLVASAGKDGNLMLWRDDGKSAADGYRRLPEDLRWNEVLPLDHSRVLLLPPGKPPELVDLKLDASPVLLAGIESSADVLGWFGTNLLCHWNETNQIVVRELRGTEFIQRGAITLDSGVRPSGAAYSATRQLLAWTEGTSSNSVYLASLTALGPRIELKSDVPGFVPIRFSEDGKYLAALRGNGVDFEDDSVRVWNVETRKLVASSDKRVYDSAFAAGGRVLVVAIQLGDDHEVGFYDLTHPDRPPQRARGRHLPELLAVSPGGGLVALTTAGGLVRLFDPVKGELIEDLHGHLNGATGIAFSVDGRRLISGSVGGLETVKLWDVGTRQELLTLNSTASILYQSPLARWSADGDVILAGEPWQTWRAPSWEEIAAAEAKEKTELKQP
jgi:eukaryotic-like serine/threonine-protein kinase